MTTLQIHAANFNVQQIKEAAAKGLPEHQQLQVGEQFLYKEKPSIVLWQPGVYTFYTKDNKKIDRTVSGIEKPLEIKGPWLLKFPANSGAPNEIILTNLQSLHLHKNKGVKYFSGTVTYKKDISVTAAMLVPNKLVYLNLGRVEVLARIKINGTDLGTVWSRPYKKEITNTLKLGINELEIQVTNLWPNRLIGDEQVPDSNQFSSSGAAGGFETLVGGGIKEVPHLYIQGKPKPHDDRVTFTTWKHYSKESPLLASGLLGPVFLETAVVISLNEML
jgi:hypothetical protein